MKYNPTYIKIGGGIHYLLYRTQYAVTSSFLRLQEYYESPEYKGKVFTVKEFKKWYQKSKNSDKFTYYRDGSGFNIPGHILNPFYNGLFDPLTVGEIEVLWNLRSLWKAGALSSSYIIATFKGNSRPSVIEHETSHALWHLNTGFRMKAQNLVRQYDFTDIHKKLGKIGYHADVFEDEVMAYLIAEWIFGEMTKEQKECQARAKEIFADVTQKVGLNKGLAEAIEVTFNK